MFYTYISYYENNKFHSVGVTSDLKRRIKTLNLNSVQDIKLVYYEEYENSKAATERETLLNELTPEIIHTFVKENNPTLSNLLTILNNH